MTCVTRKAGNRHTARHHQRESPALGSARQNRYTDPLHTASAERRHSFAVITLEQLQRGHLADLAAMTPAQRGHYQKIFGDPLDWIRRRLGHSSIESTMIYLHALQELEMRTRMELVPDDWDAPAPHEPETSEVA